MGPRSKALPMPRIMDVIPNDFALQAARLNASIRVQIAKNAYDQSKKDYPPALRSLITESRKLG